MFNCNEITYVARGKEQLKRVLSLVSVNEYDQPVKISGYIIDGENLHFVSGYYQMDKFKVNELPSEMLPTELLSIVEPFIKNTDTEEGGYGGDGSLEKGFKVFHTDKDGLQYNNDYEFSIKPYLIYYGK